MLIIRSKQGQSILQYTTMLLVVTIGVYVSSNMVIRSWNGYIKGEEDAVRDSFLEQIIQASPDIKLPGCQCGVFEDKGCGLGSCGPFEMTKMKDCSPIGCIIPQAICEETSNCCDVWQPTGNCGINAVNGDAGDLDGDGDMDCPDGSMEQKRECGFGKVEYRCEIDISCVFGCFPLNQTINSNREKLCRGDNVQLTQSESYEYVDVCTDDKKCEIECLKDLISTPTGCKCPAGSIEEPSGSGFCICEAESALQGSCPVNHCFQGGCPSGFCETGP